VTNIKRFQELLIKGFTFALFFLGLVYVFHANELLRDRVSDIHRLVLCVVFIYGSFRISQDVPIFIYKSLIDKKLKSKTTMNK